MERKEYDAELRRLRSSIEDYIGLARSGSRGDKRKALLWEAKVLPLLKDVEALKDALDAIDKHTAVSFKALADSTVVQPMRECRVYIEICFQMFKSGLVPAANEPLFVVELEPNFHNSRLRLMMIAHALKAGSGDEGQKDNEHAKEAHGEIHVCIPLAAREEGIKRAAQFPVPADCRELSDINGRMIARLDGLISGDEPTLLDILLESKDTRWYEKPLLLLKKWWIRLGLRAVRGRCKAADKSLMKSLALLYETKQHIHTLFSECEEAIRAAITAPISLKQQQQRMPKDASFKSTAELNSRKKPRQHKED